ncbi:MAG: hypothetical protein LBI84_03040, partial [Propionibacteriaceae bacterium]|nr:hypothetical protein [Propionibacteriaceae bacterium]
CQHAGPRSPRGRRGNRHKRSFAYGHAGRADGGHALAAFPRTLQTHHTSQTLYAGQIHRAHHASQTHHAIYSHHSFHALQTRKTLQAKTPQTRRSAPS